MHSGMTRRLTGTLKICISRMSTFIHTGPFLIDGRPFSRAELLAHCHMMVHDCKNPDWYRKIFQFIEVFLKPESGAILQRSSGTTGDPKAFELERAAMEASALRTISFFKLEPGDRVLLCLSVDYIAGKMMVVRALVGRLDLVLTEPSSRPFLSVEGSFRFVPMVPLQVVESLKAGDDPSRTSILLIGGGELPASLKQLLVDSPSPMVYESFGMTETYTHFGLRPINGPAPESSFCLLKDTHIEKDERGCLVVDMKGVTKGAVVSNDLVEIGEKGDQFTWLGRLDNVIKTGGIKVIPEILEDQIGSLLGTTVLILAVKDDKLGEKMVLLVEADPEENESDSTETIAQWKSSLISKLAPHEVPKEFVPVAEIPRNASFKPDRKAARVLLSGRH